MHKNDILPYHLDAEQLESEIFGPIREHPEKKQSKRIEEVLNLLTRLRAGASSRTRMEAVTRLRSILAHYHWTCAVVPQGQSFVTSYFGPKVLSADDVWEYRAIQLLLQVVPSLGKNPRIRRCADSGCGNWFFAASREDQKFCGPNCRQRSYDSSADVRSSKREYMRKHRAELKRLAKNPKSGVGLRSNRKPS